MGMHTAAVAESGLLPPEPGGPSGELEARMCRRDRPCIAGWVSWGGTGMAAGGLHSALPAAGLCIQHSQQHWSIPKLVPFPSCSCQGCIGHTLTWGQSSPLVSVAPRAPPGPLALAQSRSRLQLRCPGSSVNPVQMSFIKALLPLTG